MSHRPAPRRLLLVPLLAALAASSAACRAKPPASPHCINNTELQFQRIGQRYAKYKAGEKGSGDVYWSRYYLETARYVLTGQGVDGSGAACSAADRGSKDHPRLMKQLAARERDVRWMEAERGVAFAGAAQNGLSWTWTRTSQPVAQSDANTL